MYDESQTEKYLIMLGFVFYSLKFLELFIVVLKVDNQVIDENMF